MVLFVIGIFPQNKFLFFCCNIPWINCVWAYLYFVAWHCVVVVPQLQDHVFTKIISINKTSLESTVSDDHFWSINEPYEFKFWIDQLNYNRTNNQWEFTYNSNSLMGRRSVDGCHGFLCALWTGLVLVVSCNWSKKKMQLVLSSTKFTLSSRLGFEL